MRKSRIVIGGIVVALVAGIWVLRHRPLPVRVLAPETDVTLRIYGLGTVEARVLSAVGFELAGAVESLAVDAGDRVAAGQALAQLHPEEQQAKVAQAEAGLAAAQAALAKAEAALPRAQAVLAQRAAADTRQQELARTDRASKQSAEETQRDLAVARADLAVAEADLAVLRAQAEEAGANLRSARTLLEKHVLSAPYDALIIARKAEAGTVVKAGDTIFSLIDPKTIWIQAYIDEERAGQLALGQPGTIRLRSHPQQEFSGELVRIGLESDRVNEERKIWLSCSDCPAEMFLGEQAEVLVTTGHRDRALMLPESEITGFDGASGTAWIARDGTLARAALRFGARDDLGRAEVTGGLPEGAQIVSPVPAGAAEGRALRVEGRAP
ncbi:MAG: efflux RND transporter periplasmic adaptor subunit [Paenirhodobacter sp.]|uniref:efflux RND transporter periplasmic adaptor subunit n=1 Tax=Paenirhodobacter sp. TaxID=1965326 RepID=UPI003D09647B